MYNVSICICIHVYMYTCIHVYIYTCIHINTHILLSVTMSHSSSPVTLSLTPIVIVTIPLTVTSGDLLEKTSVFIVSYSGDPYRLKQWIKSLLTPADKVIHTMKDRRE